MLRNKEIPLDKIIWRDHEAEEKTWEPKEEIQNKYPKFFMN